MLQFFFFLRFFLSEMPVTEHVDFDSEIIRTVTAQRSCLSVDRMQVMGSVSKFSELSNAYNCMAAQKINK